MAITLNNVWCSYFGKRKNWKLILMPLNTKMNLNICYYVSVVKWIRIEINAWSYISRNLNVVRYLRKLHHTRLVKNKNFWDKYLVRNANDDARSPGVCKPQDCIWWKVLRCYFPNVINNSSPQVIDEINTHSYGRFSFSTKWTKVNSYHIECTVPNCYIYSNCHWIYPVFTSRFYFVLCYVFHGYPAHASFFDLIICTQYLFFMSPIFSVFLHFFS